MKEKENQLDLPLSPASVISCDQNKAQSGEHPNEMYNVHTSGHLNCGVCLEARKMFSSTLSKDMDFESAARRFLDSRNAPVAVRRIRYIAPRTLKDYEKKASRLAVFFGGMKLSDIDIGNFASYQTARANGDGFTRKLGKVIVKSPAGAEKINAELGFLKYLMEMAGAWSEDLEKYYLPFQVPDRDIPRALSYEQQEHFLTVAASNPRWHLIWWYSLVALDLCFSSDEMRTIRRGDVNIAYQIVGVNRRYGKNGYRRRDIPVAGGACVWALERLLERGAELTDGQPSPHHCLFPQRVVRNQYDPEMPVSESGFRKPFLEVRDAADLEWFNLNGWRHTAITRLAEAGVNMATIQRRAGHSSPKMTEHYTHISEQSERLELQRASMRKPVASVAMIPSMTSQVELRKRFASY